MGELSCYLHIKKSSLTSPCFRICVLSSYSGGEGLPGRLQRSWHQKKPIYASGTRLYARSCSSAIHENGTPQMINVDTPYLFC